MTTPLAGFPVTLEVPVAWGEMDAFQHVNNTVYLRWMESARIAAFERLGMLARMEQEGVGPILARTTIDYRVPLTYPDTVLVGVGIPKLGNSSFTMAYRVFSKTRQLEAASGETVIVLYDYRAARTVKLDDALRAAIAQLQGTAA